MVILFIETKVLRCLGDFLVCSFWGGGGGGGGFKIKKKKNFIGLKKFYKKG